MSHALSNLYVEKIASEHPIALWMLNEEAFYVSWIPVSTRDLVGDVDWSFTNCTVSLESPAPVDTPHYESGHIPVYRISGDVPSGPSSVIDIKRLYPFSGYGEYFVDKTNFALGFHLKIDTTYATQITYGFTYYDDILSDVEVLTTEELSAADDGLWRFFSNTFDVSSELVGNAVNPIIRITVSSGGSAGDYELLITGLSLGEDSENFNKVSLGVIPTALPTNISLPNTLSGIKANQYGNFGNYAYYLGDQQKLFAKNFGLPLTYGSSNSTKLYPNVVNGNTQPSLIFPGYGFLNNKGKFNQYTAEMWMSINTDTLTPRRIFGPITGKDGLYVERGTLSFVLGDKYGSHYVGSWVRPMLIHIKYTRNLVCVYLNGEQVISFVFDEDAISLPDEFDNSNKSQDWLGFYAYADTRPIAIDSFAIYSYAVPTDVAKRRFVWGQGAVAPEITNSALNATTAFSDYSFANNSVNYNYPDFANWRQGFSSNLDNSSNFLKLPNYTLPEFVVGGGEQDELLLDLQLALDGLTPKYYSFLTYSDQECYVRFNNLSVLNEAVKNLYGVFETDGTASGEVLFYIKKKSSNDSLTVSLTGTSLSYDIQISGISTNIATKTITANSLFTAGISPEVLSVLAIPNIERFFSDMSDLELFVGGGVLQTTFSGRIYKVGFDGNYNSRKINTLYDLYGTFNESLGTATTLMDHTSNYTLVALEKYGIFFMDIAVAAYWEDYMPLSYFAKYVEAHDGEKHYDLDSLQVNLDFPEPTETNSAESVSSWTYGDLEIEYSDPVALTYETLQNNVYTSWFNYEDMEQDSVQYFYYVTPGSSVRGYVSFQYIGDGANSSLVEFQNLATPRTKGVVDPAIITGDWEDTAYEIVNGTLIYPPTIDRNAKSVDFNDLAIVYHLDLNSEGILHSPINIRELQIASKVLERKQLSEIGTKFGVPVYPYVKNGLYYDLKHKNPIGVYKGSTPHLYMDRHSGFRIRGEFSPIFDRGLSIPVNAQRSSNFKVSSVQLWVRFSDAVFPTENTPILSLVHNNDTYTFYLKADSTEQRGRIEGKDSSGNILSNIKYSINGASVDTPYLNQDEWASLSIGFSELIDFGLFAGRININGPLTYNNISYYLSTNLEQTQRVQHRSWNKVKDDSGAIIWDYWENSFTWSMVDVLSTTNAYAVNLEEIYSKYVGTDRMVIDDNIGGILVDPDRIRVYGSVNWLTKTETPA